MTHDVRRARRAFLWVGVIAPLVILLSAGGVVIAWLPEVPDPSAMHWSGDGPDGFGPPWVNVVPVLIGAGLVLLFAAMAFFAPKVQHEPGPAAISSRNATHPAAIGRFLGAASLGLAVLMATVSLAAVSAQRGLTDAVDAPDIGGWVFVGFGGGVLLTVLGWCVQPKTPVAVASSGPAPARIPLVPGEKVAWFGTASMGRAGILLLLPAIAFMAIGAGTLIAVGDAGWWIYGAATIVIGLLASTTLAFRVRVNSRGLSVRSLLGWPRTQIPLADIERLEIVDIDPFLEFGGWGWRRGLDGRRGVVLRAGEALQVTRTNGRIFVVTIDGASEAAAILETLRAAPTSPNHKELS